MFRSLILSVVLGGLVLAVLVYAQDQLGFISLDCGLPKDSSYSDVIRGINYISDADFIDAGSSNSILPEYQKDAEQQLWHVRSFPEGTRNCYSFNLTKGNTYLIRATFMYGNYDKQGIFPVFDLHIGPNKWTTLKAQSVSFVANHELVHVMPSSSLHICLVNMDSGTPFISALEIRPLPGTIYKTRSGSLNLFQRMDVGSTSNDIIRYEDDVYDRLWFPDAFSWAKLSTSLPIDSATNNGFKPPSVVMKTAGTPVNASKSMDFFLNIDDTTLQFYAYFHFAEIQKLQANESRELNISFNGVHLYGPFSPDYLTTTTVYTQSALTSGNYSFSILRTESSTLPSILNAVEIYSVREFLQSETEKKNVDAITNIKLKYGVKKISWQGDPCAPEAYMWEGLNCSFDGSTPKITSLNLSSSGLKGEISPYLSNLTLLEVLDLSNNNLNGPVPEFLTKLPLTVLKLDGNNLTGSVPVALIERSNNGSLSLSVKGNQNLCAAVACKNNKKKKSNIVVPVVASVAGSIVLIVAASVIFLILKKRQKVSNVNHIKSNNRQHEARNRDFETKNRQFSYSDIMKITDNFNKTLGKGGFGTVYYGRFDQMEVAVKVLAKLSAQGFQQFEAEVKLLMRVHHRNLVSLVGYCDEDNKMALVYEYMANGDLQEHLSDSNANILSWEGRLRIAVEAAQGLEYLHNGCKPPIIHRDVKSTNILLNENFQAKLADFGLSKSFPTDNNTHVSTVVAGTRGYLDPEYYSSNRLTEKSDVFSFGVVLLEIITCRPAITTTSEYRKTHLSQWVNSLISQGDVKKIIDQRLQGDFDMNSVWKAVEIAMACLSTTANGRPTMNIVVMELNECLATEMARIKSASAGFDSKDSIAHVVSMNLGDELNPRPRDIFFLIGFISLDCGLPKDSNYIERTTGINYISDAAFIDTGISRRSLTEYQTGMQQPLWHVRSFPDGIRNCYRFNLTEGNKYLIRATFMYGNYDELDQLPAFDLHIGPNKWESVTFESASLYQIKEIIHILPSKYLYVCLVNTGSGTPFISALEIRPLNTSNDVFDRVWNPYQFDHCTELSTSLTVDPDIANNNYQPPSVVMRTAVTPKNASSSLDFYWEGNATLQFYVFMHFAEVQELQANESRLLNIAYNGDQWFGPFSPKYLRSGIVYSPSALGGENFSFSIYKTGNSTHLPILNALEIYSVKEFLLRQTDQNDGSFFPIYICFLTTECDIRNLSSNGLRGKITPYLSNITLLQYLDMSNNKLTGAVPDVLSLLPLRVLNLEGNNLTGLVPVGLIERSRNGSLLLSVGGNPNLYCSSDLHNEKKKKSLVVPVVASIAASVVLIAAALAIVLTLKRGQQGIATTIMIDNQFEPRNRQFSYSEVLKITNNFDRVLGKGGFGTVYHGRLEGTEVAVKMLSPSSVQGFQQFQAEVKILMRVHHKNLVSLVGYCNENKKMAFIYEYMANGNLQEHLSDSSTNVLSWEARLRIAAESAQGLEYLHNGCKPPIIHRDVKSTNILLNEKFQAKLADFGLSKAFPTENNTHVSTVVAGTPGYLDPDYYISNRLSEKSDVYSFGVVLLEIITSKPAITRISGYENTHISEWVSSLLAEGDIKKIVDPRLQGDFDTNYVWKAVEVAMACLSPSANKRPTMNVVVTELYECLAIYMARTMSSNHGFNSREKINRVITTNLRTEIIPSARVQTRMYRSIYKENYVQRCLLKVHRLNTPFDSISSSTSAPPPPVSASAAAFRIDLLSVQQSHEAGDFLCNRSVLTADMA
ncbi:hypothetical protein Ddye_014413 [Dipteronia dyeriana]|uniref:non-specific serine/threonine protein kinase n=1 Tax=Dipteronia dyeriana TaxID=168575 RepID=A0AAD9X879_9ROSI|nr:hypothetical protein Ddye_014413 [Dipteronia dyeriana]